MTGPGPLERLRRTGLDVRVANGALEVAPAFELTAELRAVVLEREAEIRSTLLREAVDEALDLATVDPATGDPDLSAREPITPEQVKHLQELARHPAFGEKREPVGEIVEKAVEGGLTEAGAYVLIGHLGDAIAQERCPSPEPPEGGGPCEGCGQTIGPTSKRCGRCKSIRRGRANREQT